MKSYTKLLLLLLVVAVSGHKYGVRIRYHGAGCRLIESIDYWPKGSPFADDGHGECVETTLGGGGKAYYTYTTADEVPEIPARWSSYYAKETYYANETVCEQGRPRDVELTTITNSNACLYAGASTEGFSYLQLDCTSANGGVVNQCSDSSCTNCRAPFQYEGGCADFVNSVHACAVNHNNPPPRYGFRKLWMDKDCSGAADSIDYWPIGSPFAEDGTGHCVETTLGGGGKVYYTYGTSQEAPSVPNRWPEYYAKETYYSNQTTCEAALPHTVDLVTITNSDSCIYYGASTEGYSYLKLDCTSRRSGKVYSCRDKNCHNCQAPFQYQGGCDDFVNSVHACAAH